MQLDGNLAVMSISSCCLASPRLLNPAETHAFRGYLRTLKLGEQHTPQLHNVRLGNYEAAGRAAAGHPGPVGMGCASTVLYM